jgi:hypothetical protein
LPAAQALLDGDELEFCRRHRITPRRTP